jgi:hypothetical protein
LSRCTAGSRRVRAAPFDEDEPMQRTRGNRTPVARVLVLVAALAVTSCASTDDGRASGGSAATTSPSTTAAAEGGAPPPSSDATTVPPPHPVSGTALDASGRPLAGHTVSLREDRGIASDVVGLFAATLTFGLSCAAGADPCRSSGATSTTTAGDGRFAFAADAVAQARGRSRGVVLSFGDPATEGSVALHLDPAVGGDVGDLALWSPALTVTPGADLRATVRWTGPPTADGNTLLRGAVTDGVPTKEGGTAALVQFAPHGPSADVVVDRRAIEDRPGALVLTTGFSRPRAGQRPRADWTAPPVQFPGAGAPLSRGRSCVIEGAAIAGCPLTDGDLVTVPVPVPQSFASATIDLGSAVPVGAVAVRNDGDVVVQLSADGQHFAAATARSSDAFWPARRFTGAGASARFVRVLPQGQQRLAPTEVSVWPPAAAGSVATAPAAGPLPTAPAAPRGTDAPEGSRSGRGALSLLAAVILILVAAAVAFAVGRRSARR